MYVMLTSPSLGPTTTPTRSPLQVRPHAPRRSKAGRVATPHSSPLELVGEMMDSLTRAMRCAEPLPAAPEQCYLVFRSSRRICSSASITSSRDTRLRAKLSFRLNCLVGGRNANT